MKKSYVIYRLDLAEFLKAISIQQSSSGYFFNVTTKPHKDPDKIIVQVG